MNETEFKKYVDSRYQDQMDYYHKEVAKNRKMYKRCQWVLIILSALTPVFAALSKLKAGPVDFNMIVIIVSSVVAILTTALKTFNYQELWIVNRSTYEKLKPEMHYYTFNAGPYSAAGVDKEAVFVSRVETILDSEHKQWPVSKSLKTNPGKSKT
jgi:hypothetical protein